MHRLVEQWYEGVPDSFNLCFPALGWRQRTADMRFKQVAHTVMSTTGLKLVYLDKRKSKFTCSHIKHLVWRIDKRGNFRKLEPVPKNAIICKCHKPIFYSHQISCKPKRCFSKTSRWSEIKGEWRLSDVYKYAKKSKYLKLKHDLK